MTPRGHGGPIDLEALAWARLTEALASGQGFFAAGMFVTCGQGFDVDVQTLAVRGASLPARTLRGWYSADAPADAVERLAANVHHNPRACWVFSDPVHGQQMLFEGTARPLAAAHGAGWLLRVATLTVAAHDAKGQRYSQCFMYGPQTHAARPFDPMATLL